LAAADLPAGFGVDRIRKDDSDDISTRSDEQERWNCPLQQRQAFTRLNLQLVDVVTAG